MPVCHRFHSLQCQMMQDAETYRTRGMRWIGSTNAVGGRSARARRDHSEQHRRHNADGACHQQRERRSRRLPRCATEMIGYILLCLFHTLLERAALPDPCSLYTLLYFRMLFRVFSGLFRELLFPRTFCVLRTASWQQWIWGAWARGSQRASEARRSQR